MIKRLVSFALHQPLFIFLLTGLFLLGGIVAFENLPIEAFPDVTDIQVTVITLYPGYAAEEVEKQVTTPLEIGLSGLPNAVRMFSHTQFGLSFLIVTFDDRADDYQARQLVLERLRGVDLPDKAQVQLAPLSTPIGELFRYRVTGNGQDLSELRSIQVQQYSDAAGADRAGAGKCERGRKLSGTGRPTVSDPRNRPAALPR
jgi:cobalt-zinc-cadmium resistance protein CzcA